MSPWRERLVPSAVRQRVDELCREDAEVRLLRLWLGEPKIWEWALSIGTWKDTILRSLAPPIPDERLRRITADETPEGFLWSGLVDIELMLSLYLRHRGEGACPRPRLLDFGCGCGRLLRFLTGLEDLLEAYGSDVNPDHIAWCRRALDPLTFEVNELHPPLPWAEGFFDGLWSLSVFTHLNEPAAEAWREELARVLAPGGVLLATAHGATALAKLAAEPALADRFRLTPAQLAEVTRRVEEDGFHFVPYRGNDLTSAKAGDEYGSSFASPAYLASRWNDSRFTVVEHLPGMLRGWQDVVVLKRR